MSDLARTLRVKERPPPNKELAKAFGDLFKSQYNGIGGYLVLEDVQLRPAMETFRYLQERYKEVPNFGVSDEDLRIALRVLRIGGSRLHSEMATRVYHELQSRRETGVDLDESGSSLHADLEPYICILCKNGDALVARELVEKDCGTPVQESKDLKNGSAHKTQFLWQHILRGLTRNKQNDEIEKTLEIMQARGIPFNSAMHQIIVDAFAFRQKDMEMTKQWYYHPIADSKPPTNATDLVVLKLCIMKDELQWGEPIFKKMLARQTQDKKSWHTILLWAAAKGKGVDEIEDMMKVMARKTENTPQDQPDMQTVNELIAFANERDDSYTAERYYALGQRWGFAPNAHTYLLQLEYRIKVNDLSGALTAYKQLQGESLEDSEDVPLVNKLITAFCLQPKVRYETIMSLVEDLQERKAPLNAQTIAALTALHLARNEMQELADLLNTHTFHYSAEQRATIFQILLATVVAPQISVAQSWETYNLLRATFPDCMTRDVRVQIMNAYFARERFGPAVHVFSDMRKERDLSLRPDIDIYCGVFMGLAKMGNAGIIQRVHNMTKLDTNIEPSTKLYNALMLAYKGVAAWTKAFQIWDTIIHTKEGPSYTSIQVALQVCERLNSGERDARDIWQKLKRLDIEITREIFAAYVGVLASRGDPGIEEAAALLDQSEQECGCKIDVLMLGSFLNGIRGEDARQECIDMARERYPEVYEKLLACGTATHNIHEPPSSSADERGIRSEEVVFKIGPYGQDPQP